MELAALKARESISKDETKSLVMSMCHRLTAVIVLKGPATKYLLLIFYICLMFNCPNIYAHINEWMNSKSAVLFIW